LVAKGTRGLSGGAATLKGGGNPRKQGTKHDTNILAGVKKKLAFAAGKTLPQKWDSNCEEKQSIEAPKGERRRNPPLVTERKRE